uniref:non-specific serine/threonine protein kinase n=1 Tax=Oryza brachyantha TaxID=4533 RepID=J3N6Y3_ORYBR
MAASDLLLMPPPPHASAALSLPPATSGARSGSRRASQRQHLLGLAAAGLMALGPAASPCLTPLAVGGRRLGDSGHGAALLLGRSGRGAMAGEAVTGSHGRRQRERPPGEEIWRRWNLPESDLLQHKSIKNLIHNGISSHNMGPGGDRAETQWVSSRIEDATEDVMHEAIEETGGVDQEVGSDQNVAEVAIEDRIVRPADNAGDISIRDGIIPPANEGQADNVEDVTIQDSTIRPDARVDQAEGNYSLNFLMEITNQFSEKSEIGHGGFGRVYLGKLPDGNAIAVKRLKNGLLSINDSTQFKNEVNNLMGLEHENIVRLLGSCNDVRLVAAQTAGHFVQIEENLLCLEYLSNGSLDGKLSDQSGEFEWGTFFNIIKGISSGLCYLHEKKKNGPIIHLDLKPENILLDDNMIPKIADFGLSRLFGPNTTHRMTVHIMGTLGYIAPEFYEFQDRIKISAKADIFSLGIVILEIVTGRRRPHNEMLEVYITEVRKTSTFEKMKARYPSLNPDNLKEVTGCIEIGIMCLDTNPERRPTAGQIYYALSNITHLEDGQIMTHPR